LKRHEAEGGLIMKVKDVMTTAIQVCMPETSLATAAIMMWENDCGVIPVVDLEEKVVGMITDRDICMATAIKHGDPSAIAVSEVISGNVYMCDPNDDVRQALKNMREKRVRRLPVIDEEGKLNGILSMNDAVLSAKENGARKPGLSYADVVQTFKGICAHPAPEPQQKRAGAAAA
jgi:CBS domain-containing protein